MEGRVDWSQLRLDIEQQFWADDMNIIVYMVLGWIYNGDVREEDEKRFRVRDRIQRVRVNSCGWGSVGRVL